MPMIYKVLLFYLTVINGFAFYAFGMDKGRAKRRTWRIPERNLLLPAFLGGSAGALLGMLVFRHKIRKPKFAAGVPLMLVIHAAGVYYLLWRI